jgi:hypothetical protein
MMVTVLDGYSCAPTGVAMIAHMQSTAGVTRVFFMAESLYRWE